MLLNQAEQAEFRADPGKFIQKAIKDYVKDSPNNAFVYFPGERIWDEPLVGFADGDDPLFQQYKTVVGDFHVTPREALERHTEAKGWVERKRLQNISVIAYVLPATLETRLSNRREDKICSVKWNHTRWQGQEFIIRLSHFVASLVEGMGYFAIVPDQEKWFENVKLTSGLCSNWSQRHAAYAAGLGTFSLNDGFITPKGIAVRIGSVVCNLALPATSRPYTSHTANCLFFSGQCRRCIERCPAGAITEKGHDKIKCSDYLISSREMVSKAGRQGYIGNKGYVGCGFCQTKVPCEERIPSNGQADL